MQADVWPRRPRLRRKEADRAALVGFRRQHPQCGTDLEDLGPAQQTHRAELMGVQGFGQPPQHRMRLVGGHTFHDQLPAGDADRDLLAIDEQARKALQYPVGDACQRRMARRIHRVFVNGDREFENEIRKFPRQTGGICPAGGISHDAPRLSQPARTGNGDRQ